MIPTQDELWDKVDFENLGREFDDDWRHGGTVTQYLKRLSDDTCWCLVYRTTPDGDYNGLREGDYEVFEVEPYEEVVIKYKAKV